MRIFSNTSIPCLRVLLARQILVPGYRMQRHTQYRAVRNVLPCVCYYPRVFYLALRGFLPFSSVLRPGLAYVFTYDFTVRWRALVVVLYLFNHYALRYSPAFRNPVELPRRRQPSRSPILSADNSIDFSTERPIC